MLNDHTHITTSRLGGPLRRSTARAAAVLAIAAGTAHGLAQSGLPNLGDPDPYLEETGAVSGEGAPQQKESSSVNVDAYEQIELHFRDEDLTTALQMLSMQAQRSIVTTRNVSASVTADLYGTSFYEALDAILLYNGYGYIEEDGTIYVMPQSEILEMEKAARQPVTQVIRLNYLNAADAAQFAQSLLGPQGTIVTNGAAGEFRLADKAPVGAEDYALESVLVVRDMPEVIDEIQALIRQLDTKPVSVLVEATILQKSVTDAYGYGVDFTILSDLEFGEFLDGPLTAVETLIRGGSDSAGGDGEGGPQQVIPADNEGLAVTQTVGNTPGRGGIKLGVVNDDVAVFLRLLDEMGDTTIISNPKLLTLNRQPASVQVGRRIGYLSTTTTDTATQQTVEFLDTGTQLYLRPFVANNGDIRLELRPEVSQPIIRSITDATGAQVVVPDEDTSRLSTNVLVQDGQTVVLGGLFTERTSTNRRQVPVLGDVPILGWAFRGQDDAVDLAEIIFMITPQIVENETMAAMGERGRQIIEDSRAGAREGLLFWARERRASQLIIDAERAAAAGDTREAINKLQRALALQPGKTEAISLRERLLTEPTNWPSNSSLERIIRRESETRMETFREELAARQSEAEQRRQAKLKAEQAEKKSRGPQLDGVDSRTFVDVVEDDFADFLIGGAGDEAGGAGRSTDAFAGTADFEDFGAGDTGGFHGRFGGGFDEGATSGGDSSGFDGGFQDGGSDAQSQSRSGSSFDGASAGGSSSFSPAGSSRSSVAAGDSTTGSSFVADGTSTAEAGSRRAWTSANTDGQSTHRVVPGSRMFFGWAPMAGAGFASDTVIVDPNSDSELELRLSAVRQQIERFCDREGRYPTLEDLQRAPADRGLGQTFGVLVDRQYLSVSPVNPSFSGAAGMTVGSLGSGAAWEYDEQSGELFAATATLANVDDEPAAGDDD